MERRSTAGAILAGGQARRFDGQDKSRLVVDGLPIIVRQVRALQEVVDEVFIVAPETQRFADLDLPVHPDRRPGLGAVGGLFTALDVTTADWVIVVACDLPFLESTLLRQLLARAGGHDAAWVRGHRGVEPFLACYRRETCDRVGAFLDAGHRRASALASVLTIAEIGPDELAQFGSPDRLLANVNSPADYARVQYPSS